MIEFALQHREALWRIDAAACTLIMLSAVHLMQVSVSAADHRILIGMPWPYGLETALRTILALIAVAASLTVAEYVAGGVHFVLIEEVALNVAFASLGLLAAMYRRPLFGRHLGA